MARGDEGLFLRCLKPIDERVSVKLLLRIWGPRFEFFVRLLLVATFLDDSFRAATHFSEHTKQIGEEGYLKPLASPDLVRAIATALLGVGLIAQSLGSLGLLALVRPDGAAKALVGWAVVQPVLYAQLANVEFVAESLSLIGGLLIMHAHLSKQAEHDDRHVPLGGGGLCGLCAPDSTPEGAACASERQKRAEDLRRHERELLAAARPLACVEDVEQRLARRVVKPLACARRARRHAHSSRTASASGTVQRSGRPESRPAHDCAWLARSLARVTSGLGRRRRELRWPGVLRGWHACAQPACAQPACA